MRVRLLILAVPESGRLLDARFAFEDLASSQPWRAAVAAHLKATELAAVALSHTRRNAVRSRSESESLFGKVFSRFKLVQVIQSLYYSVRTVRDVQVHSVLQMPVQPKDRRKCTLQLL